MSQAIVDPGELRRFAQEMKRFNEELQNQTKKIHARMSALSETWRDQEQQKFATEFEETMKVLHRFVGVSEKHIPFLLRKAERIEEYLQQR
jgi:uncharacterized protein YukE